MERKYIGGKNEERYRYLWEQSKRSNIDVTKVPEVKEKGGAEKVHEEITAKNFSNSAKDISMKIKKLH